MRPCHAVACLLLIMLAACGRPEPVDFDASEPPIPPAEAQSDMLDLKAGVQWLSFVPNPQREYPELYTGLDSDQRRRLQVAPLQPGAGRVALQFDLPEGSKIWPVQWYGSTLMAVDMPDADGFSVALAEGGADPGNVAMALAEARARIASNSGFDNGGVADALATDGGVATVIWPPNGGMLAAYGTTKLATSSGTLLVVVEAYRPARDIGGNHVAALRRLLESVSIKRDLALEGLPNHKCASTVEELQQGILRYPDGTLTLPLTEGVVIRKSGGGSTLLLDGHGASPWMMIRRLDETRAEGDLRARVRTDVYFSRRLRSPRARTSAGFRVEGPPMVLWDLNDYGAEHVVLGVVKAGEELLAIEVINQGIVESEARRRARDAALAMLKGATTEPASEAPELEPLVGWNIGTMGRDD